MTYRRTDRQRICIFQGEKKKFVGGKNTLFYYFVSIIHLLFVSKSDGIQRAYGVIKAKQE